MVLESEDLSQKAERVSGPQNTMKREIMVRKRLLTDTVTLKCLNVCFIEICVLQVTKSVIIQSKIFGVKTVGTAVKSNFLLNYVWRSLK